MPKNIQPRGGTLGLIFYLIFKSGRAETALP